MATAGKNLSNFSLQDIPTNADLKIGIVVSNWNDDITFSLRDATLSIFEKASIPNKNIHLHYVPGAFELPIAAQLLFENIDLDGVIVIGNVIQGETRHFDFVCEGATKGIMDVMLKFSKPISFCLLTDENKQQSIDRSGGKHGNKGHECAIALLQMIALNKKLETEI